MKKLVALCMSGIFAGSAWAFELQGEAVQGAWAKVLVEPHAEVVLGQNRMQADERGVALIAFSRDAKPQKTLTVINGQGQKQKHTLSVKQRDYIIQRIDGLPPRHVTPDEQTLAKIRQDRQKAIEARKINLPTAYFEQGFQWPAEGWVTGIYGSQRILNGHARAPHMGVDIAGPTGTPIYAPAAGEVTLVESMELSGNTIFIDHGYGLRSDFMHLEDTLVSVGDRVEKGQKFATMGATGRATGPHLHWGMSWFNIRLDPALMFNLEHTLKRGDKIVNNQVVHDLD